MVGPKEVQEGVDEEACVHAYGQDKPPDALEKVGASTHSKLVWNGESIKEDQTEHERIPHAYEPVFRIDDMDPFH